MLHEGLCIHLVFSWEAVPLNGLIVFRSCLNLATPWAGACQAPLSVGFSRQARILKWVAFLLGGIFLTHQLNLHLLHCRQTLY